MTIVIFGVEGSDAEHQVFQLEEFEGQAKLACTSYGAEGEAEH